MSEPRMCQSILDLNCSSFFTVFGNVMLFGHSGKCDDINIFNYLKPIPVTPQICVLGLVPVGISVSRHQIKMIDICLVLAIWSIAFYWKKIEGPSIGHWLKDL